MLQCRWRKSRYEVCAGNRKRISLEDERSPLKGGKHPVVEDIDFDVTPARKNFGEWATDPKGGPRSV
jgi:hypothetical protein